MTAPARTIQVWGDTIDERPCRGSDCRRRVVWAVVVASGASMPFDSPLDVVDRSVVGLPGMERDIVTVNLERNHWASCPNADQFRRAR